MLAMVGQARQGALRYRPELCSPETGREGWMRYFLKND